MSEFQVFNLLHRNNRELSNMLFVEYYKCRASRTRDICVNYHKILADDAVKMGLIDTNTPVDMTLTQVDTASAENRPLKNIIQNYTKCLSDASCPFQTQECRQEYIKATMQLAKHSSDN